ncbi:MAG: putative LPS assembly protein LptD [Candidatus Kryptoniota bacterium]
MSKRTLILTSLLTILILLTHESPAQNSATSVKSPADTSSEAQIDTVVAYSAVDSIVYSIASREMTLFGKSEMTYQSFKLNAAVISINWDTSILSANGLQDSSGKVRDEPVFNDGGETYNGSIVTYDFKTQKGRVKVATTVIDQGYYKGSVIKKFAKDQLYVADGSFTTCDRTTPDYYFQSSEMKVILKDQIIARPVIFYIEGVPVFALPFGVFPNKSGRRSGIIPPAYGESALRGRYLSHFGYFWAINDYADLTTTADWYTRGGYVLRSGLRYALRYYFSGSLYGAYSYLYTGESKDPDRTLDKEWNLILTHDQTIDPTTRLVANFNLSSGNYYRNTSIDYNQILQQNIVSDASLFKTWEGSGNSISLNIHRDQNLQTGAVTMNLPSISFNHSQSFPFRSSEKMNLNTDQLSWYDLLGYSYSGQFTNTISNQPVASIQQRNVSYGALHQITINAAPKIGYINISPFLSLTDKMYGSKSIETNLINPLTGTDSIVSTTLHGFYNLWYFAAGISASTRLFGIAQPNIFGVTAFRHTMQPTITFTYQPDFSDPFWNYYGTYYLANGTKQRYSYYQNNIYGGAPQGKAMSIGVNIGNNFEMKTLANDTSSIENKYQLLNIGISFAYNFAADSMRLSPLSVNYRTNIAQKIDIGGGATFNFYQFNPTIGTRVNRFLWNVGHLPDLTNFQFSISTSFQGEKKKNEKGIPIQTSDDSLKFANQYNRFYQQMQPPDLSIPWNLSVGFDYNFAKLSPFVVNKYANLRFNLDFNLTENWKIGFNGGYDFIQHQLVVPTVNVYRDLHCWEMFFRWNPIGYYRGFNLEIRIKAPQLHDIKITKREDTIVGY